MNRYARSNKNNIETITTPSCKGNAEGKNNPHKKTTYSGVCKFSFGILIIMIHRFILYLQGKCGNKKRPMPNNSATHILAFKCYIQLIQQQDK